MILVMVLKCVKKKKLIGGPCEHHVSLEHIHSMLILLSIKVLLKYSYHQPPLSKASSKLFIQEVV